MILTISVLPLYCHGFRMNDWRIHYWDNFWLIGCLGQGYLGIWPSFFSPHFKADDTNLGRGYDSFIWGSHIVGSEEPLPLWLLISQGSGIPGGGYRAWWFPPMDKCTTFSRHWFSKCTFDKCVTFVQFMHNKSGVWSLKGPCGAWWSPTLVVGTSVLGIISWVVNPLGNKIWKFCSWNWVTLSIALKFCHLRLFW